MLFPKANTIFTQNQNRLESVLMEGILTWIALIRVIRTVNIETDGIFDALGRSSTAEDLREEIAFD